MPFKKGTPSLQKMKKFIFYIIGLIAISIISCKDGQKDGADAIHVKKDLRHDYGMKRTHADTLAVMEKADQFLQSLKEKKLDAALDLLYEIENNEAKPLSSERRNLLRQTIGAFPVENYTIDELILFSDSDSEVRYTTKMFPDSIESQMPGTMKGSLHPYRIDNNWYLTIQPEKNEPSK